MELLDYLLVLRRRWRTALLGAALAFLVVTAGVHLKAVPYRSEIKVHFRSPLIGNTENPRIRNILENFTQENVVLLLKTPDLRGRIEERLRLLGDPDPPLASGLVSRLEIQKLEGTRFLQLALVDPDKERLTLLMRVFAEEAGSFLRERIQGETGAAKGKLEASIADLDRAERSLRVELEDLRCAVGLSGYGPGYDEEIRQLRETIQRREARAEALEKELREVEKEIAALEEKGLSVVTPENIDEVLGDLPALNWYRELNEKLIKDELRLQTAKRTKTERHPEVQGILREIDEDRKLLGSIFEEGQILNQYLERIMRRVQSGAERGILSKKVQLHSIQNLEGSTREAKEEDERRLAVLNENRERYIGLEQGLESRRLARMRLEEASSEILVLERGEAPFLISFQTPTTPELQGRGLARSFSLNITIALLLGCLLAYLLEFLNGRIHTPMDMKRLLRIDPLAAIPRTAAKGMKSRARGPDLEERFEAAVRMILSRGDEARTILIAGVEGGAGRTFIAAGLARAAARLGHPSAAVDADGREPALHLAFRRENRSGLSDLLAGEVRARSRVRELTASRVEFSAAFHDDGSPVEAAGLRGRDELEFLGFDGRDREGVLLIPAGPPRSDFPRLLESSAMRALLEELSASRDLVFIDSAPLSRCGEALSLAPRVDGVLIVGQAGVTSAKSLAWARGIIAEVGGTVLGFILNDVRLEGGALHPEERASVRSARSARGRH